MNQRRFRRTRSRREPEFSAAVGPDAIGLLGLRNTPSMAEAETGAPPRTSVFVLKSLGALVTFVIAVWGAVTGTIAWRQDREILIQLAAQPFIGPHLDDGLIRFSIINQSRHAVSISSGELWLEGRRIGYATSLVPNPVATNLFTRLSPELERKGQVLPVGVGAETTTNMAASWELSSNVSFAKARLRERNTLPEDTRTVFPASDLPVFVKPGRGRIELRLRLVPGGLRTVRVPILAAIEAISQRTPDGVASGWNVSLITQRHSVTAMTVVGAETPTVMTLRLWTLTSSRPVRTINRPVGQEVGRFDLRNLKRGTYAWSLGDERRTIGAGTLVQPCPELSGMTPNDSLTRCTLSARRARQLLSRQQRNPTGNLRPTP